jgi:hypothetical protein
MHRWLSKYYALSALALIDSRVIDQSISALFDDGITKMLAYTIRVAYAHRLGAIAVTNYCAGCARQLELVSYRSVSIYCIYLIIYLVVVSVQMSTSVRCVFILELYHRHRTTRRIYLCH